MTVQFILLILVALLSANKRVVILNIKDSLYSLESEMFILYSNYLAIDTEEGDSVTLKIKEL